jgi:glutamate decarboxylase
MARLNLATFVTTWMPTIGAKLMADTADKNMIDKDEYPQTAAIESRCVNILADLWNSPEHEHATGCSTTGSSEAAMLAGMALKWRWRDRMRAAGQPTDDGSYEPVKEIEAALDRLEADRGIHVPIHVDAASGGFVAPFIQPEIEWDFRLPRVQSINASGHKYGLVYPGVGWAVWRDRQALPQDLVFDVNYLGGNMPTFSLNFSRPGSEVIAQYYMFMSLGHDGYRAVMQNLQDVAQHIVSGIAKLDPYQLISDGSELPVFAFTLASDVRNYTVFDVSDRLRERGWLVPAYTFPDNRKDLSVLRIVVRAGMSMEMADLLLEHLREQTKHLESLAAPLTGRDSEQRKAFAH